MALINRMSLQNVLGLRLKKTLLYFLFVSRPCMINFCAYQKTLSHLTDLRELKRQATASLEALITKLGLFLKASKYFASQTILC